MEIQESQEFPECSKSELCPYLPAEIVLQIIFVVRDAGNSQSTLWACTLVSRLWYSVAMQALYEYPEIVGRNFQSFVGTICPAKKSRVNTNQLSNLVTTLDMSMLVHDGSKSLTARLLGRCKKNLKAFVAPQATFGVDSLAALSKCQNLTCLNLSSLSVTLSLPNFLNKVSKLDNLKSLHFARSITFPERHRGDWPSWPMNLDELHIGGCNIPDDALPYFSNTPRSLAHLILRACPNLSFRFIGALVQSLDGQLRTLSILEDMNKLLQGDLDGLLLVVPSVRGLYIFMDYITHAFFHYCYSPDLVHHQPLKESLPLVALALYESGSTPDYDPDVGIDIHRIFKAVAYGWLDHLKSVKKYSQRDLEWKENPEEDWDISAWREYISASGAGNDRTYRDYLVKY